MLYRLFLAGSAALLCSACSPSGLPEVARIGEAPQVTARGTPPPGENPGACYGQDKTPAVIETVTEQILVQPEQINGAGKTTYPAIYETQTRQAIVKERRDQWFETPCTDELTPDFVASLQRALVVRNLYNGPISGEMTPRTRRAIRAFQKPQGLDSSILSKAAARQLGLIAFRDVPEEFNREALQ